MVIHASCPTVRLTAVRLSSKASMVSYFYLYAYSTIDDVIVYECTSINHSTYTKFVPNIASTWKHRLELTIMLVDTLHKQQKLEGNSRFLAESRLDIFSTRDVNGRTIDVSASFQPRTQPKSIAYIAKILFLAFSIQVLISDRFRTDKSSCLTSHT